MIVERGTHGDANSPVLKEGFAHQGEKGRKLQPAERSNVIRRPFTSRHPLIRFIAPVTADLTSPNIAR